MAGKAVRASEDPAPDFFKYIAEERHGKISYEEFMSASRTMTNEQSKFSHSATFSQADINDDGFLSSDELHFASYLAHEDELVRQCQSLAQLLPPRFCEEIDSFFHRLRTDSKNGKVDLGQVVKGVRRLLLIGEEEEVHPDFIQSIVEVYQKADLSDDGVLNLNELDYLHFLLREMLVTAIVEEQMASGPSQEEASETILDGIFNDFDLNGDGLLDLDELVIGLGRAFMVESPELAEVYVRAAREHFASADIDGSGALDREEAKDLIERITRRQEVAT